MSQQPASGKMQVVSEFLKRQKVLDLNMTLADLTSRLGGRDIDQVAGYTVAWDKYVYDIGKVTGEQVLNPAKAALRRDRAASVLDLSTNVAELLNLTRDSKLDQVAGYVYTEDKKTFIVGDEALDAVINPGQLRG